MAKENGDIFELEGYGAAGMSNNQPCILKKEETLVMPRGGELMMLPDRKPIVFNILNNQFQVIEKNPYHPDETIYPVAVFNSPGFVNRFYCAYSDEPSNDFLPLFSYGAVGFGRNNFRSAAILVDKEPRQDLRQMPHKNVLKGINRLQKKYPGNRLVQHLETCARQYGCPAGKNFFLQRYEAPLPTSKTCNARCLGCISLQTGNNLCACQERIKFTPTPTEIAEVALEHITHVKKAVVSFGQGCEGDPLTAFNVIQPAIRLIREKTDKGTINLNTNASLPLRVEALSRAGLDGMRVSMNSVRDAFYNAYFRPKNYPFSDVKKSIQAAKANGVFVAVNYLNCPGFSDCRQEASALMDFIEKFGIDMIQWRNLNFDPKKYCRLMSNIGDHDEAMGMANLINAVSKAFPTLIHGYFNPPKENYENHPGSCH